MPQTLVKIDQIKDRATAAALDELATNVLAAAGISGIAAGMASFIATASSATLRATMTDETGTGALVFADTPTLVTPILGEATGTGVTYTGYLKESVGNSLTAAGTTRADALQLSKAINHMGTVASGTGVILPTGVVGMTIIVFNAGANVLKVYANGSETIDGTAGSTGVSLTNANRCAYFFMATNTWISAKLGVVSS